MKAMKKLSVILIMTLLMIGTMTASVSAAPKLNKKSKTMTVGQRYTLKVKGISSGNIKKVTFKSGNKKVVSVSKDIICSKKSRIYKTYSKACVRAKKKGKATITVRVTYWTKKSTLKTKKLKFKVTVKKAKNNKASDNVADNAVDDNIPDSKTVYWYESPSLKWINAYTFYDPDWSSGMEYGLVYSDIWKSSIGKDGNCLERYSKEEYDNVMKQLNGVLKEVHITEANNMTAMSDQEKAYRIGRWMTDNLDYAVNVSATIQDTLVNKKAQCHGFAVIYKILCDMAGVDCEYVYTVDSYINGQNMNHAWNIVKLGNYWYVVDMTGARNAREWGVDSLLYYFRTNEIEMDSSGGHIVWLHPYYKSKEFMSTHPIDTLELPAREKADGVTFMTDEELYNLPR